MQVGLVRFHAGHGGEQYRLQSLGERCRGVADCGGRTTLCSVCPSPEPGKLPAGQPATQSRWSFDDQWPVAGLVGHRARVIDPIPARRIDAASIAGLPARTDGCGKRRLERGACKALAPVSIRQEPVVDGGEVGRSRLMMLHGAVRNGRQITMVYSQRLDHLICPGFDSSSRAVNSITHNTFAQAAFGERADGGAGDVAQDLPRAVRGTARVKRN